MINAEKLLYQPNKSGSTYVVFFILLNMLFTILTLKSMDMTINLGIFTLFNILVSLVGFLASTKYSIYKMKWAYGGTLFSLWQAGRIFFIPEELDAALTFYLTIILLVSAGCLLIGSLITIRKTKIRNDFEASQTA